MTRASPCDGYPWPRKTARRPARYVPVGGHEICPLTVTGSARHEVRCLARPRFGATPQVDPAVLKRCRRPGRDK